VLLMLYSKKLIMRDEKMKTRAKQYGNANVVGKYIEKIRLSKGIRQNDFIARLQANGLDINPTSYSKLEGQLRQVTDIEIYYIAKVLNLSISDLYSDYEKELEQPR